MDELIARIAKASVVALIAIGFIGIYFFDNIKGYYRFKAMCDEEGGLRVYTPLKKNVGWIVQGDMTFFYDAAPPAQIKYVIFVRYKDIYDGRYYDIRYVGGNPGDKKSYSKIESNFDRPVFYSWKNINENLPGQLRLSRSGYEVREITTGRIVVRYYEFGYSKFDHDKTLLAAPSGEGCFNDPGMWLSQINSNAFEK